MSPTALEKWPLPNIPDLDIPLCQSPHRRPNYPDDQTFSPIADDQALTVLPCERRSLGGATQVRVTTSSPRR
jgi:hypothetical protein